MVGIQGQGTERDRHGIVDREGAPWPLGLGSAGVREREQWSSQRGEGEARRVWCLEAKGRQCSQGVVTWVQCCRWIREMREVITALMARRSLRTSSLEASVGWWDGRLVGVGLREEEGRSCGQRG